MDNSFLNKNPDFKFYRLFVLISLAILFLGYILHPATRDALLDEDSPLEDIQAAFYFTAFFLGLWYWHSKKISPILPAIAFLGFLEEITYGSRIIGYNLTDIIGLNTHSLHGIPILVKYHLGLALWVLAIGAIIIGILTYFKQLPWKKLLELTKQVCSNTYLPLFIIWIIPSQAIDFFSPLPAFAVLGEEGFELAAAITILFAVRQASHEKDSNLKSAKLIKPRTIS